MNHLLTLALTALTTLPASAAPSATDTLVVTTNPQMHCEGCEARIKTGLRFVKGTKKIVTSLPTQTVTIIYDARKATPADYLKALSKIGYEAQAR